MRFGLRSLLATIFLISLCASWAHAGPPFLTDDPEPVEYKHYEYYTFSAMDHASDGYSVAGPAFEFNMGAAPNLQLHIVAPFQLTAPNDGPTTFGVGDTEVGAKYRFFKQKGEKGLQIGAFPMVELPSGDASRGLGNGTTWVKMPIWVQKGWGEGWQSYGGGGYIVNDGAGMRNTPFFGWQVQKEVKKDKLTLGAEWFNPGRQSYDTRNYHLVNVGGIYNFSKNFSLLFTGGHSIQGPAHMIAYLGLYWTWGKDAPGEAKQESRPASAMSSLFHAVSMRSGGHM